MPNQPDFEITARIPTDKDQREGDTPEWCDLTLTFSDPIHADSEATELVAVTVYLTRAAGEVILDTVNSALHPHAGGSARDRLWEDLDTLTDLLMDETDFTDGEINRGKARGIARALAILTTPYDPDMDAITDEAMERWEGRQ